MPEWNCIHNMEERIRAGARSAKRKRLEMTVIVPTRETPKTSLDYLALTKNLAKNLSFGAKLGLKPMQSQEIDRSIFSIPQEILSLCRKQSWLSKYPRQILAMSWTMENIQSHEISCPGSLALFELFRRNRPRSPCRLGATGDRLEIGQFL
jgi:hypothetical protein